MAELRVTYEPSIKGHTDAQRLYSSHAKEVTLISPWSTCIPSPSAHATGKSPPSTVIPAETATCVRRTRKSPIPRSSSINMMGGVIP